MSKALSITATHRTRGASASPGRRWRRGFTVIGHRGAAGLVAENTLPSFQRAAALGCKAVELDVYAVDEELLVIHDDTLNRTTNGKGRVMSKSAKSLRALDAGQSSAVGAQIPLLSEVFAALPAKVAVNIELKGPATATAVAAALRAIKPQHEILVSSFDHDQLRVFRGVDQETAVAPLFHRRVKPVVMLEVARELNACAVNMSVRIASKARLEAVRGAGYGAVVYTVNNLRSAKRLLREGATGVFTDRPDRISDQSVTTD